MDLNRQIGSLFIIGFSGSQIAPESDFVRDIETYGLGGVILFNRCLHDPRQRGNIGSPVELKALTASLQALTPEPLLICVDQEGGAVRRLTPGNGFPDIPSARQMADASDNTANTVVQAERTATMLADMGITVNFAPVVDLDRNPDNPIIGRLGRSFSADPYLVAQHGAAWIKAHRRHGVISCLKHFPGHGSSAIDSHLGFVDISDSWHKDELIPYRMLLADNLVDMIMTGHLFNRTIDPLYPATLSATTVTEMLRGDLDYRGVVVSDDLQMRAITDRFPFDEALCRAVAAGVDLMIIGNNLQYRPSLLRRAVAAINSGLDRGLISEKHIVSAYQRVKRLKLRAGKAANESANNNP